MDISKCGLNGKFHPIASAIEIRVAEDKKHQSTIALNLNRSQTDLIFFWFEFADMMFHSCVHWVFLYTENVIHCFMCFEILLRCHRFWTTDSPARLKIARDVQSWFTYHIQ